MTEPHIIPRRTGKNVGVIVLAHGATRQWNSEVERACCARLAETYPTVVVFGMAPAEKTQDAVNTLEALGVQRIVVVPLLISSHSELFRQTEYILRIRNNPDPTYVAAMHEVMQHPIAFLRKKISWASLGDLPYTYQMVMNHRNMRHDLQVESRVPLTLLRPLDSDPLVSEILEERVNELSDDPSRESVVLVAHGPLIDQDNVGWLGEMEKLADPLRSRFRSVSVATIRDDAEGPVKDGAILELREKVRKGDAEGTVIVVPLLISQGGIEKEVRHILSGLKYRYNEKTLLPHQNIERWLLKSIHAEVDRHLDPVNEPERHEVSASLR